MKKSLKKGFNKLFVKNTKQDQRIEDIIKQKPQEELDTLVFAVSNSDQYNSRLYLWTPGMMSPVRLTTRELFINDLCFHEGDLYDTGDYNQVLRTYDNKEITKRERHISSLCSHEGKLYDASWGAIRETFTDKKIKTGERWVNALCSYEGNLYDGGSSHNITNTFTGEIIAKKKDWIHGMCVHDNEIYYTAGESIYKLNKRLSITSRKVHIGALISFEGQLIDGGYYPSLMTKSKIPFFSKEYLKIPNLVRNMHEHVSAIEIISNRHAEDLMNSTCLS